MKKALFVSFVLGFLIINSGFALKKVEKSQKAYNTGLKYYLKRDFQKASEAWQKALEYDFENQKAKMYFNKAQDKYYESLKLYYDGVSLFNDKKYDKASEKFKESLLINPLNKKVKFFIKLCAKPIVNVSLTNSFFTVNNNRFVINFDKSETVDNWASKWSFKIEDEKGKVLRMWEGKGESDAIVWDGKDENGQFLEIEGQLYDQAIMTSYFGREVSSEKKSFKIDTKGPELNVNSESNFSPDNLKNKKNLIHFIVNAIDGGSGIKKIRIEIYNAEKDKKLYEIEDKSGKNIFKYTWDGAFSDSTKMVGGSTVYYKVIAQDKAENETISDWHKIDSEIILKQEAKGLVMNLPNIEFDSGKATLKKSSYAILLKAGEILARYNEAKFVIEGHTDNVGSDTANLKLSQKRAQSVYNFLKKKFKISKDRVQIKGYGESKPIAPNDTAIGRAKNRRVEIVIVSD